MKKLQALILFAAIIVIIAGAITLNTEFTMAQEQPPGGGGSRCPTSEHRCSVVCNCSGGENYYCHEGGQYMRCFGDAQCSAHCVH